MRVISAESTELFTGPPEEPLQLVRVHYRGGPGTVRIDGDRLTGQATAEPGDGTVEVPVTVRDPVVGQRRDARVTVDDPDAPEVPFVFTVAEPGWTLYMVSHFHYDPVWWNTQGAYTSEWTEKPPGRARQTNGFDLVRAHLEMARREPEYKFVLAEVDYLKPFWDAHPEERDDLRRFIAEGRVEIMGGTYNEPNTNLTSPETTIRNFVHGMGFQRDILGASPATAWQLDVFGHDPQFPGMAADAGLTSSSWARGPHHQWGPMADGGDPQRMQFSSEFEWIAPSGRGLLTHYMPAHYSAGWWMDSAPTLAEAEQAVYELFLALKKVALTRNVLLPVGTDYTPPNKWVTEIHRDWNARYTWPRFVCAVPGEFFAAVRRELSERGISAPPQTRDMNPIYTGKDVSYIDTKQANRATEDAVLDAETFAVFAALLAGARYPQAALAKAWVQLAYGAHHDAITGSESDQVYLDLLTSWRDAWELGRAARTNALTMLSGCVAGTPHHTDDPGTVVVWNPLTHNRTDVVTVHFDEPVAVRLRDPDGGEQPVLTDDGGHTVRWLARDVPSLGWKAYRLERRTDGAAQTWKPVLGNTIRNEHYELTVDPERGGGVRSLVETATGRELIAPGRVGNELALYDEYPAHPKAAEGPWHLLPKGPVYGAAGEPARVRVYRGPLGERIVVHGRLSAPSGEAGRPEEVLRYTQTLTLWHGVNRVDCRTTIDGFTGVDRLLRVHWPCPVPGARPVSEVGDAVIGRPFALLHHPDGTVVDTAQHPWTLDNPAYGWFGLSATARIRVNDTTAAMAVAEVVTPAESAHPAAVRDLMVALVRSGVTATCSGADRPRYGDLEVDSNLPDTRIALGGPDENAFTAAVLAQAGPAYTDELKRQLYATGTARVWVPAETPVRWVPGADLRGARALPVLVVAGADPAAAITGLARDLADFVVEVDQEVPPPHEPAEFVAHTVAVLNRGIPGFAVEPDGTLHLSLMRSCTGWPSGTWIDPPRRTVPDGSNFALQHWTHTFDYALVSGPGDWRAADIPERSAEFSRPLAAIRRPARGHGGLPPWGSLLEIRPAKAVRLAALKATGNPLARGSVENCRPADGVTLRLVETRGTATDVEVSSGLREVSAGIRADLLEQPRPQQAERLRLHGFEIATVLTRLNLPQLTAADDPTLAPEAEQVQPLYARYWLHNRGPAPLGGLPVSCYLHPQHAAAEPGATTRLRLTVASDCTDEVLHGRVRLGGPAGWTVEPDREAFILPPGEYLDTEIAVTAPADAGPGLYPLRAELAVTGARRPLPPAWRQVVEDVGVLVIAPLTDESLLRLVDGPEPVEVARGATARLSVRVGTDAYTGLTAEAHLISPWDTWEWIGPAVTGVELPARGSAAIGFDVAPPPWAQPGEWWALIRVAAAGRLVYSPAVPVVVT
ncbi:NPCBM-associated, NEW3 domain of alpha-galactosidase family protein [Mycolicibacterium hassiacum DSM 44199]|uniref:NPCBM-associated, NEW3 domain of alpha-galactosidase family protein n=1 Tax=Mycolicibacterium hassiacum (strain DSM 44199 / CIP 105218 / JCM 12690 / 3849) TaxID=1122247 RepID=K5BGK1_MYCHD|nr:NEW3 domain-containing protein [Mycolicibacterium hassiacum]EKF24842.1 NPCBM-associated, NEW3 domain of alpha-galactosidase family protein [Mycolicibacterium hassiacum DSM 44199]MDA4088149.1 alpha-mannosidase [Mycolicibacterium hassiacum DSM 44199]VCT88493.1 Mannosylglycerate hydrolase [Mycolicibacterium hassiacum DSM 44199]